MDYSYSLMSLGGGISSVLLLCLVLLGVFKPDRVANWSLFRIAWIVIVLSVLLPGLTTAIMLVVGNGSEYGKSRGVVLMILPPCMVALGAILTLFSMKLSKDLDPGEKRHGG